MYDIYKPYLADWSASDYIYTYQEVPNRPRAFKIISYTDAISTYRLLEKRLIGFFLSNLPGSTVQLANVCYNVIIAHPYLRLTLSHLQYRIPICPIHYIYIVKNLLRRKKNMIVRNMIVYNIRVVVLQVISIRI